VHTVPPTPHLLTDNVRYTEWTKSSSLWLGQYLRPYKASCSFSDLPLKLDCHNCNLNFWSSYVFHFCTAFHILY